MATWIVGDVHGCAAELSELAAKLALTSRDELLLVGDLFDKGPDPVGVLAFLRETKSVSVLGNHDVLVRDHGAARLTGTTPPGRRAPGYLGPCLDALEKAGVLLEAVELCRALALTLTRDGFLIVHAGMHPYRGVQGTDERLATTVREFPRGDPQAKRWWMQWSGAETVVFGHDARQGLVRHEVDGRLRCVGIDTGCVYGGRLTAYCLEEDRLVQVPARQRWIAKGRARVSGDPATGSGG